MKVKKLEKFQNKMGLKGCKWSSLNAPGTETPQSHPYWELGDSPFPLLALWGNKIGLPSMKVKKFEKFQNKIGLKGCKWSSLNAPGTETPQCHPYWELGEFPFLIMDETEGIQCLGPSNWTICSPLSPFCSEIFPTFSLSYWGANSYYPRGQ